MTTTVLPAISAQQYNSFTQRIANIKKWFGGPRWLRNVSTFSSPTIQKNYRPVEGAKNTFAIGDRAPGIKPVVDVAGVLSLVTEDETVEVVLTKEAKNLIALAEVAYLSKPTAHTTKSKILKWIDSFGGIGVPLKAIQNAFPEIAPSGISSRVSEMVRSGQIVSLGKFHDERQGGALVSFYTGGN